MTIELSSLLGVSAVIIIPGLIAWITIRERVVRLEERVRMQEQEDHKMDKKLDKIFEEIKEVREEIRDKQK